MESPTPTPKLIVILNSLISYSRKLDGGERAVSHRTTKLVACIQLHEAGALGQSIRRSCMSYVRLTCDAVVTYLRLGEKWFKI